MTAALAQVEERIKSLTVEDLPGFIEMHGVENLFAPTRKIPQKPGVIPIEIVNKLGKFKGFIYEEIYDKHLGDWLLGEETLEIFKSIDSADSVVIKFGADLGPLSIVTIDESIEATK